jgi:hypothetical protein
VFLLVGLGLLLSTNGHTLALRNSKATGADVEKRIRFQITTIEESSGARHVLSEASVEGAPGTDFTISLQSAGFKMNARFLTDLINQNALKVRTKLETRRFFGYSEQKLPVYEEDNQIHALHLNFDEGIVLVPFGSHGGSSVLKIEIAPSWSSQTVREASGKLRPLQIDLGQTSLGGSISIQASHKPHRFAVDAVLYEDGQEVARGSSNSLLEEAEELTLRPNEKASAEVRDNPLAVNFRVDEYSRSRPVDEVVIGFDIFRVAEKENGRRAPVGLNWAGAGELGSALKYDLTRYYLSTNGHLYELRFTVKLGEGEVAD